MKGGMSKKANHGTLKESAPRGQTIQTPFGKDPLGGPHGSKSAERGQDMAGHERNLAHSVSSGSAKQRCD